MEVVFPKVWNVNMFLCSILCISMGVVIVWVESAYL